MPTPSPSRPSGSEDPLFAISAVGLALLLLGWLLWFEFHAEIVYWSLRVNWTLLGALDWSWAPRRLPELRNEMAAMAGQSRSAPFVPFWWLLTKSGLVMVPLVWLLLGMVARTMWRHPSNRIHRVITADTLPWIMAKHSPAVIPTLYYGDLLKTDPPEHRSALTPEAWAIAQRLVVNQRLERDRALTSLAGFLGPRLASVRNMQLHEQALFAVFAARLFSNGEALGDAQNLLDALNRSCHVGEFQGKRGYPQLELAHAQFERYADHAEVSDWVDRHGYARTLLFSMHEASIKLGKLPASNFRWLKGMDRSLWYALNTTGRKVPFVESLAVFTQARWETYVSNMGLRLERPYLDDAVDALEAYLVKVGVTQPPPKKTS